MDAQKENSASQLSSYEENESDPGETTVEVDKVEKKTQAKNNRVRAIECGIDNLCILEGVDCKSQIGRGFSDEASSFGVMQPPMMLPLQRIGGHKGRFYRKKGRSKSKGQRGRGKIKKQTGGRRRRKKQTGGRRRRRFSHKKSKRRSRKKTLFRRRLAGSGSRKKNMKGGRGRKVVSRPSASGLSTSAIKSIRACHYRPAPRKRV
jgi:hypothetical protein